jgi:hypothetical protein
MEKKIQMSKRSFSVFVDKIDWEYEVEEVEYGTKVYPDLEAMKEYNKCWESCGVVRCTITEEETVVPTDWDKGGTKVYSSEELKKDPLLARLISANAHKEYLESLVKKQVDRITIIENKIKEQNNEK